MNKEEKERAERVEIFCWIGLLAFVATMLLIASFSLNQ